MSLILPNLPQKWKISEEKVTGEVRKGLRFYQILRFSSHSRLRDAPHLKNIDGIDILLTLINSTQIPLTAVAGTYNVIYVILSYIVSVIASRIAIIILQETDISQPTLRFKACCLGGLVMGAGIWSMHFTGMLAFKMPMEHTYQPGLTILSMAFAALFSLAVFYNITRENLSLRYIFLSAPVMGLGVAVMHYTGMAAMDMRGETLYLSNYFWASIVIAIVASGAAMWIMRYVTRAEKHKRLLGISAALIMGLAVCGMHYTGMAATVFVPFADCRFVNDNDQSTLLTFIVMISLMISLLGVYLVSRGFLKESKHKHKLFSLTGTVLTNSFIVFIGATIAWFIHYESRNIYMNNVKHFQTIKALEAKTVAHSLEDTLWTIYNKLTTLSEIHFTRNLARKKGLTGTEDLMNIALFTKDLRTIGPISVQVFPAKTSLPIAVDLQKMAVPENEKNLISQIIQEHIQWFQGKHPTSQSIKGKETPAISDWISVPIGNGDSVTLAQRKQITPIIYSVPVYEESGNFSGIVSALFTTDIFTKNLYTENAVLLYQKGGSQFIYPSKLPPILRGSLEWIKKEESDPKLLYSAATKISVPDEKSSWIVWQGSDDSVFLRSAAFINIEDFRLLGYSVALIMTLLGLGLFNIMRRGYQMEFEKEAEANKSKSEFLSNMSHELRTPMHAILNYASMGIKNLGDDGSESLKKYFGNIQIAGNRLMILLNNLLDLAKLESGKTEFHMAETDFRAVIDHTFVEIESLLEQKQIKTDVKYTSASTMAVFDKDKMIQVMINLMSNAMKFSPENSTIHIKIENVNLPQGDEGFKCSVTDEGVGIPEDEVDTVFDKFIQSSKTKTQAGGTGLGLSICKQIVEAHGGTIWAKNNMGKAGTTFSFQFPKNIKTQSQSEVA